MRNRTNIQDEKTESHQPIRIEIDKVVASTKNTALNEFTLYIKRPDFCSFIIEKNEEKVAEKARTDGAMIRSKTSCEVAADAKEKEVPEAGPAESASSSAATSSEMAATAGAGAGAPPSARETSAADALQERDRNSSGSRGGSGGRSGRSPPPPLPILLVLAAPVSVMEGAGREGSGGRLLACVACMRSQCARSCRAWACARGERWWWWRAEAGVAFGKWGEGGFIE